MAHVDLHGSMSLREATTGVASTINASSLSHDRDVQSSLRDRDVVAAGTSKEITRLTQDTPKGVGEEVNNNQGLEQALTPPLEKILHISGEHTSLPTPPSPFPADLQRPSPLSSQLENTASKTPQQTHDEEGSTETPHDPSMLFSYRTSGPSSTLKRRRQANTSALTEYEADLTGQDRARQKDAVRKLLAEKVRDDWKWVWPREHASDVASQATVESESKPEAGLEIEEDDDAVVPPVQTAEVQQEADEENYKEVWKQRDEWLSGGSGSEEEAPAVASKKQRKSQLNSKDDAFRFETPDGIGEIVKKDLIERKRRRKKRSAEEMAWNDGYHCFNKRRDAWTGARRVRRSSTKQLQKSTSHSSQDGGSFTAMDPETEDDADEDWEADTEILVAPPLIPPENAMRASITPTAYHTIYDKVILQNLSPSCPINLKDITRSCVQGWKRDGEWPPKSSVPDSMNNRRRRKSLASLFGLEKSKSKEDKVILENEKEKFEKETHKDTDDHKPGAFKKFTRKLMLLGKDKEHENSKEHGNQSNSSNGKAKEAAAT